MVTVSDTFTKVCRIGTVKIGDRAASVFVKIQYDFRRGVLSITGVEGPLPSENARGGCGRINMSLKAEDVTPAKGWDSAKVAQLLAVWNRWHLNDMRAGTPAQEEYLRANPTTFKFPASYFDSAKAALEAAGLEPDNGYHYGSRWLKEEVPADVLDFLRGLPDTDKKPAWV